MRRSAPAGSRDHLHWQGLRYQQVGEARARPSPLALPLSSTATAARAGPGWGLRELTVALRWAGLCLSLLMVGLGTPTRAQVLGGGALTAYATARTIWPLQAEGWEQPGALRPVALLLGPLTDLALTLAVVAGTGFADSPYIISLGAASFVASLHAPPWAPVGVAVLAVGGLVGAAASGAVSRPEARLVVERLALLGATGLLGSYSEWLVRAGRESRGGEVERLQNLTEVNHLLLELHAKAAAMPTSLNLKLAIANSVSRLEDLLSPDVVLLVLSDPTAEEPHAWWEVVLSDGVALAPKLAKAELAPVLQETMASLGPVCRSRLTGPEAVGPGTASGLYVPLWARGSLIGILAIERSDRSPAYVESDLDIVSGIARHAGLAIDNARWFHRLRTLGAEEERGRIARELHDRVGQSLAYIAISLDRLARQPDDDATAEPDEPGGARAELEDLAGEVRTVAREIRTKLSDLRLEPMGEGGLPRALSGLLSRAQERSGIATSLTARHDHALPPMVEREVVLIAQEAITNAERHSRAKRISVRWTSSPEGAELEVTDDGVGTSATAPLRRDAYGILGMRERADAIGASLAIASPPGHGTRVRLRLGPNGPTGRLWAG